MDKGLVAASATPLILAILRQEDSYGYNIIEQVRQLSEGELEWADGMLYPILHRLEAKGHIESYWGKSDTGRRRKYYRLCVEGLKALNAQRADWNRMHALITTASAGSDA